MCGRYTVVSGPKAVMDEFGLIEPPFDDHKPRYNIAPTQQVLAIVEGPEGLRAGQLRWGLVPSWASDPAIGSRMINARAETLTEKPAYRELLERRRCLIVADGFYEWLRNGRQRIPMRIHRKDDAPFAFAGLWDKWIGPNGETLHTCTIITTPPNELVRPIHDRMPAILPRGAREKWAARDTSVEDALALLVPCDASELEAYPVSSRVNDVGNDSAELVARQESVIVQSSLDTEQATP